MATIRSDVGQEGVWKLGGSVVQCVAVAANLPAARRRCPRCARRAASTCRSSSRTTAPTAASIRTGCCCATASGTSSVTTTATASMRTYPRRPHRGCRRRSLEAETFERPAASTPAAAFPKDPKELGPIAASSADGRGARRRRSRRAVARELGDASGARRRARRTASSVAVPCSNRTPSARGCSASAHHAEVLAPADVRAELVAWLRRGGGADERAARSARRRASACAGCW